MFGLGGIGLKIAIAAILFSVISGGYFYIQSLRSDLKLAAQVQAQLEDNIRAKDAAMEQTRRDIENMNRIQGELNTRLRAAENTSNELARRFNVDRNGNERNLGRIAGERPAVVEVRINRGTRDALRCNEIITGSPLTEDERNGKVRNSICQNLLPAPTASGATR